MFSLVYIRIFSFPFITAGYLIRSNHQSIFHHPRINILHLIKEGNADLTIHLLEIS